MSIRKVSRFRTRKEASWRARRHVGQGSVPGGEAFAPAATAYPSARSASHGGLAHIFSSIPTHSNSELETWNLKLGTNKEAA